MKHKQVVKAQWRFDFDWDDWCAKWIDHDVVPIEECPATFSIEMVDQLREITLAIEDGIDAVSE